jgi:flagellar hook assembly protein FlgD
LSALIQNLGSYRVTWDESADHTASVGLLLRTVPNPFRTTVGVRYHLPAGSKVRLAVYDVAGRRVRTLVDNERGPGWQSESWDGEDERGNEVPSGIYFTILEAGSAKVSRKCVLVR